MRIEIGEQIDVRDFKPVHTYGHLYWQQPIARELRAGIQRPVYASTWAQLHNAVIAAANQQLRARELERAEQG